MAYWTIMDSLNKSSLQWDMHFKNLRTVGKEACTEMYHEVLSVRNLSQAKFPSIGKLMNTLWGYAPVWTHELDLYVLKRIMVSKISFGKIHAMQCHLDNALNHTKQQVLAFTNVYYMPSNILEHYMSQVNPQNNKASTDALLSPCYTWAKWGTEKLKNFPQGDTAIVRVRPGHSLVVLAKTPHSQCRGAGFNPCSGHWTPHAATKCSDTATKDSTYHHWDWRSCVQLRPSAAK